MSEALNPSELAALVERLRELSSPPYDSAIFGGPMRKAANALDAMRGENERLTKERDAWRQAMQRLTPGGSEFTRPQECEAWAAMLRTELHNAKCDRVREQRKTEAAEAKLREIARLIREPWPSHDDHHGYGDRIDCILALTGAQP